MELTRQDCSNIINLLHSQTERINFLENEMDSLFKLIQKCDIPIQFINFYKNESKYIHSSSKMIICKMKVSNHDILDKLFTFIPNYNFDSDMIKKVKYNRLLEHFEFMDDYYNFFINNSSHEIIIPKNKIIKVWINYDKPIIINSNTTQFPLQLLLSAMVIWMGNEEYINDIPDNLTEF